MTGFPSSSADPCQLHPDLWCAHQWGRVVRPVVPTGFAELDAQLPGGGWPCGVLTELLLGQPGVGEIRLLAPSMARQEGPASGSVMWFGPPAMPCTQALQQLGVDVGRLIVVHGREGTRGAAVRHLLASADLLWALEQALRSAQVSLVLAWLPDRLAGQALRRLQLAAQAHEGPAFMLRSLHERSKPSPAPLRLALHPGRGPDEISLQVLKRRGPAAEGTVRLCLPPVLPDMARRRWAPASPAQPLHPALPFRRAAVQPLRAGVAVDEHG